MTPDPEKDLVLDRRLVANPAQLWRCWTEPELLPRWFCPPPWRVTSAVIEPWPGGRFETVMEGPEGERHEGPGCILIAVAGQHLAFTDALGGGFRPNGAGFMTAHITFIPQGDGTAYRAVLFHADAGAKRRHEEMGFHEGWGMATDQLENLAKTL